MLGSLFMECKLMFSGDQWVSYFPPRNEIEPEDNTISDEPVDETTEPTDESTTEPLPITDIPAQPSGSNGETGNGSATVAEIVSQTLTAPLKTPNTGTMASPCGQKTVDFPWWLIFVIALGDMAILWFFLPRKSKNSC